MADELKEFCKEQLKRFSHLDGYPKEKLAIQDYLNALMVAASTERIRVTVDEFIQAEPIDRRCPTAAMIRKVAYDKQEIDEKRTRKCPQCDGTGMVTVWRLVTYRGYSWVVEKSEELDMDWEQARQFGIDLQAARDKDKSLARQAVLSAAKDCSCRSGIVKVQNA
jgi:hypothetical protein